MSLPRLCSITLYRQPRSYILSSFQNLRRPHHHPYFHSRNPSSLDIYPSSSQAKTLAPSLTLTPSSYQSLRQRRQETPKSNVPILLVFIRQREALLSIYALRSTDDVDCIILDWIQRGSTLLNLARQIARFADPVTPFDAVPRDQRELLPTASCSPHPSLHTPPSLSFSQRCTVISL